MPTMTSVAAAVLAISAGLNGSAVVPSLPIVNPTLAYAGDSRTEYGNVGNTMGATTVSRDTTGLITITGLNVSGDGDCIIANILPQSLEVMGAGHRVSGTVYTVQTNVTGIPLLTTDVTINPSGLSTILVGMDQIGVRGHHQHWQSLALGGLQFGGNYGKQGATSEQITQAVINATLAVPLGHFVVIEDGVNNITPRGADSVAQAIAARAVNIAAVTSRGRRALVLAVQPVGQNLASYQTINTNIQALNTGTQALCDSIMSFWLDIFTPIWDVTGSTNAVNPGVACAFLWAQVDSLHASWKGAYTEAAAVWPTVSALMSLSTRLPIAYNSASNLPFCTKFRIPGPYTAAPGYATVATGFFGGGSGTRPSAPIGWNCGATGGTSSTCVMSVVADPGDGFGPYVQVVITPLAAGSSFINFESTGVTLATLGLNVGDKFTASAEVSWNGWAGSNASQMYISINAGALCSSSGGTIAPQTETASTVETDIGVKNIVTGVATIAPGTVAGSTFQAQLFVFYTAAGTPITIKMRRTSWDKVTTEIQFRRGKKYRRKKAPLDGKSLGALLFVLWIIAVQYCVRGTLLYCNDKYLLQ